MKITIITVCYNSEKYIEQTIKSVVNQTYADIEYIIVDGLSTDNTPKIIDKYKDNISIYLRGKDKNMYDAINKGMRASTGDYIVVLNSDDCLAKADSIQKMVNAISADSQKHDIYYGNFSKYYEDSHKIKTQKKIQTNFLEVLASKHLTFVGHGTVFLSRHAYETIGEYDCDSFRAAADYDYILRVLRKFECKYVNVDLQMFRVHEESITSSGSIDAEKDMVLTKNGYDDYHKLILYVMKYYGWSRFVAKNIISIAKFHLNI